MTTFQGKSFTHTRRDATITRLATKEVPAETITYKSINAAKRASKLLPLHSVRKIKPEHGVNRKLALQKIFLQGFKPVNGDKR